MFRRNLLRWLPAVAGIMTPLIISSGTFAAAGRDKGGVNADPAPVFTIGATISGLAGSGLVLINNGSDNLQVSANGSVVFPTALPDGAAYEVRVRTQPSNPNQQCNVSGASGKVQNAPVSLAVSCITQVPRYSYSLNTADNTVSIHSLDATTGLLRPRGHVRAGGGPMHSTRDPSERFFYVANRSPASVSAYTIDAVTGHLTEIAGSPYLTDVSETRDAINITMHPSGRFLYVSSETTCCLTPNIATFRIDANSGALTRVSPLRRGDSIFPITIDARGQFAYVAHTGTGEVYTYGIDANTGALTEVANSRIATGIGTFDVILHPSGKFAFVQHLLDGRISAYAIDQTTGALTASAGSPFAAGFNLGAPLMMHPSGRFLYQLEAFFSAAGAIVAFRIDEATGALTLIGRSAPTGQLSTHFAMDPAGRFIYANASSANLTGTVFAFRIDSATGALTLVNENATTPTTPGFLHVDPSSKFLYVTNRNADTLYSYSIDQATGGLTPLDSLPTQGTRGATSLTAYASSNHPAPAVYRSKFAYVPDTAGVTIANYDFDATGGAIQFRGQTITLQLPQMLVVHPSGRFVAAVSSSPLFQAIATHPINPASGILGLATSIMHNTGTVGTTALVFNPNGRGLYHSESTHSGTRHIVTALQVNPLTGVIERNDFGPNVVSTDAPAPAVIPPTARAVFTFINGAWQSATIEDETGRFPSTASGAAPAIPRTAAIAHPSSRWIYVANTRNPGSVEQFEILSGADPIRLRLVRTVAAGQMTVALAIEPTGRFLYAANNAEHTISMYRIDPTTGALTALGFPEPTVMVPFSINADYSGRYLHVLSRGGQSILSHAIQSNGVLGPRGPLLLTLGTPGSMVLTQDIQ
ncbi:MAG: beta-propeller fold lactonase family protein [Steroidobacter sp.]